MADESEVDVDGIIEELRIALDATPECKYASRFIKSIPTNDDNKSYLARIVLTVDENE